MNEDASYGYDAIADAYMAVRSMSGRSVVQTWAASLPSGSCVVDIGAGYGEPLTPALINEGLTVYAIDASPAMVKAFQQRFPHVQIACEAAEHSSFFDRTYNAALAVGLIFLLPEDTQRALIHKIAGILNPEGSLLFSAPRQACSWSDSMTGRPSYSLGADEYEQILTASGLYLINTHVDEGNSYYYEAQKL